MLAELVTLGIPAVWIGMVHCVCGPDHYVPFVAMSRVGLWSLRKTLIITLVCGVGHVLGSAVVAFIGIALGLIVSQIEGFEGIRGDIAAWMLLGFGGIYTLWGVYYALWRGVPRDSLAAAESGAIVGAGDHAKATALMEQTGKFTPWVLFTIFLFGPCEPLIPMLMVPASEANFMGVVWVTFLFGLTTLVTMTALVALMYRGAFSLRLQLLQQWGHALAGSVVMACGASILFLGL